MYIVATLLMFQLVIMWQTATMFCVLVAENIMIVSTEWQVCYVVCGKLEKGQRVMARDLNGNVFVAIVKIVL